MSKSKFKGMCTWYEAGSTCSKVSGYKIEVSVHSMLPRRDVRPSMILCKMRVTAPWYQNRHAGPIAPNSTGQCCCDGFNRPIQSIDEPEQGVLRLSDPLERSVISLEIGQ